MSRFLNGYFVSNSLLLLLYLVFRLFLHSPSQLLVPDISLPNSIASSREVQVLTIGTIVVFMKYIRSPTWEVFFMNFFFYYKCCFFILLYFTNVWAMSWYLIFCSISWMLFKMPIRFDEHKFTDINSISELESQVLNTKENWVVLFYSPTNYNSIATMPIWCDLTMKYTTKGLKFGRVNSDEAKFLCKKCVVDTSGFSRQIPSLILYSQGKENKRFPPVNSDGEIPMVVNYKVKEIIKFLGIDRLYLATKDN